MWTLLPWELYIAMVNVEDPRSISTDHTLSLSISLVCLYVKVKKVEKQ